MVALSSEKVGVAFDMHGCPNRCRHCFIGNRPNRQISEDDVRWVAGKFRKFARDGEDKSFFEKLWVSTWLREPDFPDNYRELHELAAELSDDQPWRYELLSIWRLARDPDYAQWAKSVGPDTCQITFFGEEETTDWFCRRTGSFRDNLLATEQLLEVGMKPRWQIFANTRGIGELDRLMQRVDAMRLPERVADLGGQFDVFVHTCGVCAESLKIECLRPTVQDMQAIPGDLLDLSRKHFGRELIWQGEAELCREILNQEAWFPYALDVGHMPWFFVDGAFDVFFNEFGTCPWWRLGNVKSEGLGAIFDRMEENDTPGLRTISTIRPQELVQEYGDLEGQRVYGSKDDLLELYVSKHCQRAARR